MARTKVGRVADHHRAVDLGPQERARLEPGDAVVLVVDLRDGRLGQRLGDRHVRVVRELGLGRRARMQLRAVPGKRVAAGNRRVALVEVARCRQHQGVGVVEILDAHLGAQRHLRVAVLAGDAGIDVAAIVLHVLGVASRARIGRGADGIHAELQPHRRAIGEVLREIAGRRQDGDAARVLERVEVQVDLIVGAVDDRHRGQRDRHHGPDSSDGPDGSTVAHPPASYLHPHPPL